MIPDQLKIESHPQMQDARMLLGLSGWMDGGEVSSGTVEHLADEAGAKPLAHIDPEDFFIYNIPASMEITAMFRPHGKIEQGLVKSYEPPANTFSYDESNRLVLFSGQEPNLNWRGFAECIFQLAAEVGVSMIYFVGSVGGMVPHTREPRLFSAVSNPELKKDLESLGVRWTDYEGPVSLITYMLAQAEARGVGMATLVAEIPAYVQGRNPKSLVAMLRKVAAVLQLQVNFDDLRDLTGEWEKRLTEAVQERSDLAKHIKKLEEDYDNEIFDTQMGDLKDFLERQGIRVD